MRGAALIVVTAVFLAVAIAGRPSAPGPAAGPAPPDPTEASSPVPEPPGLPSDRSSPAPTAATTFTMLDAGYNTGFYNSVVLDAAGHPVVSYYDDTASALIVIRCHDVACRERTRAVVDEAGHTGLFTSLRLDADRPVVSYYDLSERRVRLARCHDPACQQVATVTLDADTPELSSTALAVDEAGAPLVAYRGGADSFLRLARCADPDCTTSNSVELDGPGVDEGVALHLSGQHVTVAYRVHDGLRVATCSLPCNEPTLTTVDGGPGAGFYASITSGSAGLPVLAHLDFSAKEVELVRCRDRSCADRDTTVVDDAPLTGFFASLALDRQDRPLVAFYDEEIEALVLVSCGSASCEDPTRTVVDATPLSGQHIALALDGDTPVMAYHEGSVRSLWLVRCGDRRCAQPAESTAPGVGIDAAMGVEGRPVVVYRQGARAGVRILRCLEADCGRASLTAADDVATVAGPPSLVTDATGSPMVAFRDLAAGSLRLTRCTTRRCPFLVGDVVLESGSVGHEADLTLTATGTTVIAHRDETRGTLEIVRCGAAPCTDRSATTVADTVRGGGGLVAQSIRGEEVVVAYHDDRTGNLELARCDEAGCAAPRTLASGSAPIPLAMDLRSGRGSADVDVAVVHRSASTGELELVLCSLPCRAPTTIPVPVGATHPSLRWNGRGVELVHALDGTTVRRQCSEEGCGAPTTVLPVVGRTAVTTGPGGGLFVAVLPADAGGPALAICEAAGCRQIRPELEPVG